MKRTVLVVVGALVLGVGSAAAQAAAAATGGIRFGVGAGLLLPMGTYNDGDKAGFIGGVDGTYWLASQPIGIRIEGSYSQTSEESSLPAHKTKILGCAADVVHAFGQSASSARPYIRHGL